MPQKFLPLHSDTDMVRKKVKKTTAHKNGIHFHLEKNAAQMMRDAVASMPAQSDKDRVAKDKKPPPHKQRPRPSSYQIDLHGLTLRESQQRIDALLRRVVVGKNNVRVKIITGKGRHQQRGEHLLARDVHSWLRHKYRAQIVAIEQSPHDVKIGDLPLRGHFAVVLRRP